MKKYFKLGLAVLVPFGIVWLVINGAYKWFNKQMLSVLPSAWGWQWWYVLVFIIAVFAAVWLLGFITGAILSKFKIARWAKKQLDKIMDKIPIIGKVYGFGLEIADALIADGKLDGKIKVVAFDWNEWIICYGLLTNERLNLITSATTPNPTNGFLFQVDEEHYWEIEMTIDEYLKTITSMGKLAKWKWLRKINKAVKEDFPFADLTGYET